jgi:hypothetical protein
MSFDGPPRTSTTSSPRSDGKTGGCRPATIAAAAEPAVLRRDRHRCAAVDLRT